MARTVFFFSLLEAQGQKLVWQGQSKMCQIVERREKQTVKGGKNKITFPGILKGNDHRLSFFLLTFIGSPSISKLDKSHCKSVLP